MTNDTTTTSDRGRLWVLLVFAVGSFAAVASGAATLAATGVPSGAWMRNPVAWLVGFALGAGLMFVRSSRALPRVVLGLAVVAIAATFLAPAQSGVHRWIDAGPLHINVAALVLPAAIVALAFCGIWSRTGLAFAAGIAALLIAQPDASQATSFLLAVVILLAAAPATRAGRLAAMVAALLLAAISWIRPDPLQPVAEVEGIFPLAFGVSPLLAAAAGIALAAASLAPLALRAPAGDPHRRAAFALTGYFIAAALCPAFGAFPVPLVGLGMSFPVGYWLGIAMLCAKKSSPGPAASTPQDRRS